MKQAELSISDFFSRVKDKEVCLIIDPTHSKHFSYFEAHTKAIQNI